MSGRTVVTQASVTQAPVTRESDIVDIAPRLARPRKPRLLPLPDGWPLIALIVACPVWWALGLGVLIYPIMAVFMLIDLVRRPVRVPRGFGFWLVFLVVVALSHVALGINPAGTVVQSLGQRLPGVLWRLVGYATVTIIVLYAYNLSRAQFSQRRLIRLLAWLFAVTVVGGLVGKFFGHISFTSPVELLLPSHVRHNSFVQALIHPSAAQIQQTLGYEAPRPAAPWGYTNTWGNMYVILLIWFVVWAFVVNQNRAVRWLSVGFIALSIVPVVYSLNRGLWVALGALVGYFALRMALRGRIWVIGAVAGLGVVLVLAIAVTPLGGIVSSRFSHGQSNAQRQYTTVKVLKGMNESPLFGYGATRLTLGSDQSIGVGKSTACPECGNHTLGSNGQLWNVIYLNGIVGAVFYLSFLVAVLWRYRRDYSPIAVAGSATVVSTLVTMFFYNQLIVPLAVCMLACVLMWRNRPDFPGAPVAPEAAQPRRELPRVAAPGSRDTLATAG